MKKRILKLCVFLLILPMLCSCKPISYEEEAKRMLKDLMQGKPFEVIQIEVIQDDIILLTKSENQAMVHTFHVSHQKMYHNNSFFLQEGKVAFSLVGSDSTSQLYVVAGNNQAGTMTYLELGNAADNNTKRTLIKKRTIPVSDTFLILLDLPIENNQAEIFTLNVYDPYGQKKEVRLGDMYYEQ